MKILFVTNENIYQPLGGISTFNNNYLAAFENSGHTIKVFLTASLDSKKEKIHYSPNLSSFWNMLSYPYLSTHPDLIKAHFMFSYVIRAIEEFKPDIIHLNDRQTVLPFLTVTNIPKVFTLHLIWPDAFPLISWQPGLFQEYQLDQLGMITSQKINVYSDFMITRLNEHVSNPSLRSKIVKSIVGIDFNHFTFHKKRANPLVVSYFGRINSYHKGFEDFVELSKDPAFSHLQFKAYGKIEETIPFEKVNYLGHITDPYQLKAAYQDADIVIMPSKYEPFGFVGLEAIASGCAFISYDHLGMEEYKYHNACKSSSLKERLQYVLDHWKEEQELVYHHYRNVLQHKFSLEQMRKSYENIYNECV